MKWNEGFRSYTGAGKFYAEYEMQYKYNIDRGHWTLPIAAAYNAGFDEGYQKARNELWHTLQTKND
jgi:hypothetical protein